MTRSLCISVTFLQPVYHGRTDGGRSGEWPPSPMRLFQALTAAAFGGCAPRADAKEYRSALGWLEQRKPPEIIAVAARRGTPCTLFVPNNDSDLLARAWAKGRTPLKGFSELKTAKVMRPHHLDEPAQVHFLWEIDDESEPAEAPALCCLARRVVALGWGTDLVACDGLIIEQGQASRLCGERWKTAGGEPHGAGARPVPKPGSLHDLEQRHGAFLESMDGGVYVKPPPFTAFRRVVYRRASDTPSRPVAAFALRPIDGRAQWRAFRQERAVCVAAMVRHVTWEAAKKDLGGWRTQQWAEQFVAGHGHNGPDRKPRFSYIPLPSIAHAHADGMIRRVLIVEPPDGDGRAAEWASLRLNGMVLREEGTNREVCLLEAVDPRDLVFRSYMAEEQPAMEWSTITPVILPGYDDGNPDKRARLLRRCLAQAGYDAAAVELLEARCTPFNPASEPTRLLKRPQYLGGLPACHVHLRFRSPTSGPIALGAGRHCGLGVFSATPSRF